MANKRIILKQWNGGISNDPNVGQSGSFAYGEGIEIRTDSKKFEMSRNSGLENILTKFDNKLVAYLIQDNVHFLRFHNNGQISNIFKNDIDSGNYVTKLPGTIYNAGVITTTAGVKGFIISQNKIYKWNYDGVNYYSLGIYSDNSSGIVTNGDFSSGGTGWTYGGGTDWTFDTGSAKHTAGNTTTLSQVLTTVNAQSYRVEVGTTGSIIAGSCVVKLGGTTIGTITTTGQKVVGIRTATSTSETLELIPTTDFVGSLDDISVIDYNLTSQTHTSSFQESCPILYGQNTFYVGNGSTLVKVDTSLTTWVISNALTIDLDYTIKGMTRIGDQIFIYASNGSSGKQYLWDGSSTSVLRQITWVDRPIMNVANFANLDYVFTGGVYSNKTQMWRVDGYQLTLIYQNDVNNNSSNERIYFYPVKTNAIETIGTKLLIPGLTGIYTYGQFTPGMPYSLVKEYTNTFGSISAMYYAENANYALWYSGYGTVGGVNGVYEVQNYLLDTYSTKKCGYLVTSPIFGDCLSNKKNTQRFVLGCDGKTGNNWINIYRKDVLGYATITVPRGGGLVPTVGSVYSIGGYNYTITNVLDTTQLIILQCTCSILASATGGTITKVSGNGETTYYSEIIRYQQYITTIDTFENKRFIYNYPENFNKISFAFELLTNNSAYTPAIYDFNLYYDETDDGN